MHSSGAETGAAADGEDVHALAQHPWSPVQPLPPEPALSRRPAQLNVGEVARGARGANGPALHASLDRLPRWIGALAICILIGFAPWIVYLGMTIPATVRAQHYDVAWIGFDVTLWSTVGVLAICALRRHPATGPVAAVSAMMFLVDAWFDVFTNSGRPGEFATAIVLALGGEVPLAVLLGWGAVRAERLRHHAHRQLRQLVHRLPEAAPAAACVGQLALFECDALNADLGLQSVLMGRG